MGDDRPERNDPERKPCEARLPAEAMKPDEAEFVRTGRRVGIMWALKCWADSLSVVLAAAEAGDLY